MKAVDTNVLVRFLVGDDERQAKVVYAIFKEAERAREQFFVPMTVVLELLWVLESAYEVSRRDILEAITELMLMPILKFESQNAIRKFVRSARESRIDLSDLLIAHAAEISGCERILTFDKKASRFKLFELI